MENPAVTAMLTVFARRPDLRDNFLADAGAAIGGADVTVALLALAFPGHIGRLTATMSSGGLSHIDDDVAELIGLNVVLGPADHQALAAQMIDS